MLVSCSLDVDPRQSIDAENALDTSEGVNAAINSVYARLRAEANYGRNLLAVADALADVGRTTNNSGRFIGENNNQPNAHFNHWQNSYFAINEANILLDRIAAGNIQGANEATINRWEGELKFLRALYYFDLVKAYTYMPTAIYAPGIVDEGGIPMPLEGSISSDVAVNRFSPRATIDENYDQIMSDLNDAIELLTPAGRGVQFASGNAAQALLARVALYRGDYQTAVQAATGALAGPVGTVLNATNYAAGWTVSVHPESVFEVRFQLSEEALGVNVSLQSSYTVLQSLDNRNGQGGWGDFIPQQKILDLFGLEELFLGDPSDPDQVANNNLYDVTRNNDVRGFQYTTGNTTRNAGRNIENVKFIAKNDFPFGDNTPVIRKSELHLIRAEANFFLGNTTEALQELNDFKALRGLDPMELSGDAILEEILLERLKEFAFEGHRFFDLKRLGRDIDKTYIGPANSVEFTDFRILPPIPQREIDGNPNLNQNVGY
ncbi:MAG: RagB/SusD family nutrient uptake outer membrane protein [Nitritalea sp.]